MKKPISLLLAAFLPFCCCLAFFTGCAKPVAAPASDPVCSAREALAWAKENNCVTFEDGRLTSGGAVWKAFYKDASAGKPAGVLCAHYYTLDKEHVSEELWEAEKDAYPKLFFIRVAYNGSAYTVSERESSSAEPEYQDTFGHLLHFTGKAPAQAAYKSYDNYVLADDPTATWEGITEGLLSSQAGAGYKHYTVYGDFIG